MDQTKELNNQTQETFASVASKATQAEYTNTLSTLEDRFKLLEKVISHHRIPTTTPAFGCLLVGKIKYTTESTLTTDELNAIIGKLPNCNATTSTKNNRTTLSVTTENHTQTDILLNGNYTFKCNKTEGTIDFNVIGAHRVNIKIPVIVAVDRTQTEDFLRVMCGRIPQLVKIKHLDKACIVTGYFKEKTDLDTSLKRVIYESFELSTSAPKGIIGNPGTNHQTFSPTIPTTIPPPARLNILPSNSKRMRFGNKQNSKAVSTKPSNTQHNKQIPTTNNVTDSNNNTVVNSQQTSTVNVTTNDNSNSDTILTNSKLPNTATITTTTTTTQTATSNNPSTNNVAAITVPTQGTSTTEATGDFNYNLNELNTFKNDNPFAKFINSFSLHDTCYSNDFTRTQNGPHGLSFSRLDGYFISTPNTNTNFQFNISKPKNSKIKSDHLATFLTIKLDKINFPNIHTKPTQNNNNYFITRSKLGKNEPETLANFTENELTSAVSNSSNRKSPGHDLLLNEIIKLLPESALKILLHIYNSSLLLGDIPTDWKLGIVYPIFKDGNQCELDNYRAITLLPNTYKLFMYIINNRVQHTTENKPTNLNFAESQYGFRNKRSTTMPLHIINNIITDANIFNKDLWLIFVDIIKAFDSIELWSIIEGLEWKGVDIHTINFIKNINTNCYIQIITPFGLTNRILTGRGVKQGCPLSPALWNFVIDPILHYLNRLNSGYRILRSHKPINNLAVADDIILMESTRNLAQLLLNRLNDFLTYHGLLINNKKSAFIGKTYKYLGVHILPTQTWSNHTNHVKNKITPTLESLARNTLYSDQYVRAINAITSPAITYGMGIINYSPTTLKQFDILNRKVIKHRKFWLNNTASNLFHSSTDMFGLNLTSMTDANEYLTAHSFYRLLNLENTILNTSTFSLWRKLQSIHADPTLLFIDTSIKKLKKTSHFLFFSICKKYGIKLNSNHPLINPINRLDQPDFYFQHNSIIKSKLVNNESKNTNAKQLFIINNNTYSIIKPKALEDLNLNNIDKSQLRYFRTTLCDKEQASSGIIKNSIKIKINLIKSYTPTNQITPPSTTQHTTLQLPTNSLSLPTAIHKIYTDGSCHKQIEKENTTNLNLFSFFSLFYIFFFPGLLS
ncbi:Pol [Heterostelium album PN500]|uniref:Pol n=1 Tax=Heterostelium pallidum (strain ATCC 26659 / Pp 5 / PN500) TaxID=670386 RepID=D3BEG6_HETP5|nr:Pol [Heterostelium album PN500]EFA80297.1 Pol [Heterostelium album PN500]|eukprot:XP_020432417.1 Pol [Heterostelium album PN500]